VNLVSEEMGASTDTVEKVLGLMEKLEVYAASIYVEEGEAHVGWMDSIHPVMTSLRPLKYRSLYLTVSVPLNSTSFNWSNPSRLHGPRSTAFRIQ